MKTALLLSLLFGLVVQIATLGAEASNQVAQATNHSPAPLVNQESKTDWSKVWGNIIAFINLITVFLIYSHSKEQRQRERGEDIFQRIGLFWIEKLILEPSNAFLHDFFNEYETRLGRSPLPTAHLSAAEILANANTEIVKFKTDYHRIRKRVVEPLMHIDQNFRDLEPVMRELEDLVTNYLARIPGVDQKETPEAQFRALRRKFFELIYQGEVKFAKESANRQQV